MDSRSILYTSYLVIGILLILFNKQIAQINYKLMLYYTDKLNLKDVFIFKVDNTNRNSLFTLTRAFTLILGLFITATCIYFLYFK